MADAELSHSGSHFFCIQHRPLLSYFLLPSHPLLAQRCSCIGVVPEQTHPHVIINQSWLTNIAVLNSRFSSRIGYLVDFPVWLLPKRHTWKCLGKDQHVPPWITDKLSLLVNCRSNWLHALRRNSQGRLVLRWSQADLQPCSIKQILLACCVPGTLTRFCADTHSGMPGGTPQSSDCSLQQRWHPYGALWRLTWWG